MTRLAGRNWRSTLLNLLPEKIAEVLNVDTAFVVSTLEEAGLLKHN
jgi:hypothetical protein